MAGTWNDTSSTWNDASTKWNDAGSAGAQSITPSGIASVNAFGTATLAPGAVNIAPAGIASTTAFGAAALSAGTVNIAPVGIASTAAFGTAALSASYSITATGIASTTAFGTLSIAFLAIFPPGIPSTTAFGSPVISAGPVNLSFQGIPSSTTFGATIVGIGDLVSPVYPYTGYPQDPEIESPAWIEYREDQWEDGPWVMPPYAWIFPQPAPVMVPERGADPVHAAWLAAHPLLQGHQRRMGDSNRRPVSVLPPSKPTPPIRVKPVAAPTPRRMGEPPPPRLPVRAPVPAGVPVQNTETEEGPWVMPPYEWIFPQPTTTKRK